MGYTNKRAASGHAAAALPNSKMNSRVSGLDPESF